MTLEDVVDLIKLVALKEIKSKFFAINGGKAPRLDGYSLYFFKAVWHIVGKDVVVANKHFFFSNKLLPVFNSTIMALIPKC